jgi:hypothetical protein
MKRLLRCIVYATATRIASSSNTSSVSLTTSASQRESTIDMNYLMEFFSNKFDHLLDRVEMLSNETSLSFDNVNQKFDKRFDDVNQKFDKRFDDVNKKFDDVNKRFDDVNKRFDLMNEKFSDMSEDLLELLSSTQTPRSALLVDSCARQSVFLVRIASTSTSDIYNTSTSYRHCSAFAYQPFPSRKAVIVTASHCLSPFKTPFDPISITYLGDDLIHDCSVLDFQSAPEDSSILTCPGLTNLIGLVSSGSSRLSQSVAITGFAVDTFKSSSTSSKTHSHHVPFSHFNSSFALNVDFSRIVSIAGPPHKLKDGSVCVSSPGEVLWSVNPSGFVDRQVTEGMSGGPILDLKCGVVGISHGRSCNAGAFVDLTGVDRFITSMEYVP